MSLQSVQASPEERAQVLKARILDKLTQDGFQLVQESQSQVVVERPITGSGEFVVRLLTTGANGSRPVFRWTVTIIPQSDHYTRVPFSGTINSQNAFGQMTSIQATKGKNLEYMKSVLAWASAGLPKKYKIIKP